MFKTYENVYKNVNILLRINITILKKVLKILQVCLSSCESSYVLRVDFNMYLFNMYLHLDIKGLKKSIKVSVKTQELCRRNRLSSKRKKISQREYFSVLRRKCEEIMILRKQP